MPAGSPRKLSDDDVSQIVRIINAGVCTGRSIARQYGVTSAYISRIKHGHRPKSYKGDL